jgi:UDP-N-acetyl-D-mannosaminuronic acid transferase (WecB/TagA/CpsF family)
MPNTRKHNIIGILMDVVDYPAVVDFVVRSAAEQRGAAISALAVQGVMTGVLDREQKFRLNHLDLLVPDGQPIRCALNLLHRAELPNRANGPKLTLKICARAAAEGLPVYFYGSTTKVLASLGQALARRFPSLPVVGIEPSKFRHMTPGEKLVLVSRIRASGGSYYICGAWVSATGGFSPTSFATCLESPSWPWVRHCRFWLAGCCRLLRGFRMLVLNGHFDTSMSRDGSDAVIFT